MLKLGINLTPFAHYISIYSPNTYNLLHIVLESEQSNIDSIQIYFGNDFSQFSLEDLVSICTHSKKFINICMSMHDPNLTEILRLNPDMITFCDSLDQNSFEVNPINTEEFASDTETIIERLKNKNILSSMCIKPEVKEVKSVAKYEVDYLHLNLYDIHQSENRNEEIEAFQKLEMALIAAEKFGFGVSIYGDLNTFNAYEYNSQKQIEEIFTGKHLFERSMRVGLSNAIQEYSLLLKNI